MNGENNFDIENINTNNNKQKIINQQKINQQKINQEKIKSNKALQRSAVRNALRSIALKTSNNNTTFPVTKSQVIKYHNDALKELSRDEEFLLKVLHQDKDTKFIMTVQKISLPQPLKPTLGHIEKQNFLYNLVSAIKKKNNTNNTVNNNDEVTNFTNFPSNFQLDFELFKISINDGKVIIRYYPYAQLSIYIRLDYEPPSEIASLIKNIKLPSTNFDFKENIETTKDKVTAKLISIILVSQVVNYKKVTQAMREASYPPRFWQSTNLKEKAQNNATLINKNAGTNFSGSKLSRIEQFLEKVETLFEAVAQGNFREEQIPRIIQLYKSRATRRSLIEQQKFAEEMIRPLKKYETARQNRFNDDTLSESDKMIVALSDKNFDVASMLTTIITIDNTQCAAIRTTKGRDFGIILKFPSNNVNTNSRGHGPTDIDRCIVGPTDFTTQGQITNPSLFSAVRLIASFCFFYGFFNNRTFLYWFSHLDSFPTDTTGKFFIKVYKEITNKKINKLFKKIPKNFSTKLFNLLKAFCEAKAKQQEPEFISVMKYYFDK